MPYVFKAIIVGLAAGYLSGQFGVGGGIVTTPGIRLILGKSEFIALGTPLVVMIPTVLSGAYIYRKNGLISSELILPLSISGIVGIIIGSAATAFVSVNFLMLITAFIILVVGLRFMSVQIEGAEAPISQNKSLDRDKIKNRSLLVGLACGFFSGFLGLGGGILLVPALTLLLQQDIKEAFGTSLMVILFYALPGSVVHFLLGHIDLRLALLMIIGTIPGAFIGAKAAIRLPASFLKTLFGLFLIAVAVYFAYYEILAIML